jgi:hypothetical protein
MYEDTPGAAPLRFGVGRDKMSCHPERRKGPLRLRRAFFLAGLIAIFSVVGCDRSASGSVTPSGSASEASSPSPRASAAPDAPPTDGLGHPPRLPDADLDTLMSGLKCSRVAAERPGPCKVLLAMENCKEWAAMPPAGDGRFIGHGWRVAGQKTSDVITLLRTRKVREAEVAPWQLPIKIALGSIGKDAGPAFAQADSAIGAYTRRVVPPSGNAAVDYVKGKSDWADEMTAARTMGAMVETFSDHPTYICQGEGPQIELVRQASTDIGLKSDGLYAELWAASW